MILKYERLCIWTRQNNVDIFGIYAFDEVMDRQ